MHDEQPNKISILRDYGLTNSFTVISANGWPEKLTIARELTFDEVLGYIARLCCPTCSDGNPIRSWGKPLFLESPFPAQPKHPDAAGDNAPAPKKEELGEPINAEFEIKCDMPIDTTFPSHRCQVGDLIVTTRECTPTHWQSRANEMNGKPKWIWDAYPTTGKVIRNKQYEGPIINLIKPFSLDTLHSAAVSVVEFFPF